MWRRQKRELEIAMSTTQLTSAIQLARQNGVRFPNESVDYRHARDELLAEEIELRRHIERVAEQRRALPPGGTVPKSYMFIGEKGPVHFSELFGDKQTLAVYSYMYGPKREQPCPMCTSLMAAWDGESLDVEQRIALVMVARSPIERLLKVKKEWLAQLEVVLGRRRRLHPRLRQRRRRRHAGVQCFYSPRRQHLPLLER